jgi:hypothetical protein
MAARAAAIYAAAPDPKQFWANPSCFNYTMSALATTDRLIAVVTRCCRRAVRTLVGTQAPLEADVGRATDVGSRLFPPRRRS